MKKFNGYFGEFGGRFVPETLIPALLEVEDGFYRAINNKEFLQKLNFYLKNYAGRPTPLYFAENLTKYFGTAKIYLKREDLCHTGSHKINNTIGQALLAKFIKKKRVIAETGAGQHGVATASACALLGLKCEVYMGATDIRRQSLNVYRMKLLGANVIAVNSGSQTLKDAINEALRDWTANVKDTYYLIGSVVGPHPYPLLVRYFQSVIGDETKKQFYALTKKLPDYLLACVGGGSNSIGLFYPFYNFQKVKFIGVEAAGKGLNTKKHSATLEKGRVGVLHGSKTYLLQDRYGQIMPTHSISAGLDYPGVGPEHAYYKKIGRAKYVSATDQDAIDGFKLLSDLEGIIPALEPSHAIGYLKNLMPSLTERESVILCLSGRGDKDVEIVKNA